MPSISDKENDGAQLKQKKTAVDRAPEEKQKDSKETENVMEDLSTYLLLFRSQALNASGDIFFKASKFHRSKKYHAELRGSTVVAFRSVPQLNSPTFVMSDIIAVLEMHNYNVDIVERDDGYLRIYITPFSFTSNALIYIKVTGGPTETHSWRYNIARAKASKLPSLSSLKIESVIGRGGGGKVFLVRWNEDNRNYALKVIDKHQALRSFKTFRNVASERFLMEEVGPHPFLLQMQFAFQTERNLFIGTPLCSGGDLATYLRQKGDLSELYDDGRDWHDENSSPPQSPRRKYGRLSEEQTRRIATEIVLGLEHLHSCGIVYRDLKPENIFIDDRGNIKIGDYGLAKHLSESKDGQGRERTNSICGTRNYLSPEMLKGNLYSFEADLWSLGVVIYRILCGRYPFDGNRTKEVFHNVKRAQLYLPSGLSIEAQLLLRGLLEKDPACRLKIPEIKNQAFFGGIDWDEVLQKETKPSIPDVDIGSTLPEVLENFEVSKLEGITVGEYVGGEDEQIDDVAHNGLDCRMTATNRMIGFEHGCFLENDQRLADIPVTRKVSGIFAKLTSIDFEQLPLSPRRIGNRNAH